MRNQIWIGGKLKLSTSHPFHFSSSEILDSSYELGDSSAKSITLSTVFGIL
ncbi:Ubiquitin carboxyl-terminal hydrolase 21 -like protein [Gossypium arboreum]|uniref:Ubiquitin carboxyl-terminal hydrolase 21-like protein n=1 Tax=Gossypium arboreum TaxID=29729 RepID=A0A0B0PPP7_GOSAR|nr:Ubiquitin carboxyl-terminal hydrolase 21 -like protein [Gossypium arboreum]